MTETTLELRSRTDRSIELIQRTNRASLTAWANPCSADVTRRALGLRLLPVPLLPGQLERGERFR